MKSLNKLFYTDLSFIGMYKYKSKVFLKFIFSVEPN